MQPHKKVLLKQFYGSVKFACNRFASAKYGAIITDMKGKLGGHVAKGSVSGSVFQTKGNPIGATARSGKLTKADAGRVISVQQNLAANATNWRNLSSSDQTAWNAAAPSFPFVNKFGVPYTASGFQLYMSVNNNMLAIGQSPLSTPPSPSDLTPTPAFTIGTTPGVGAFSFTCIVPTGYYLTLSGTGSQSLGRTFDPSRLKAIKVWAAGTHTAVSFTTEYENVFGTALPDGNFWFEGKLTKADAGRTSVVYRVNATT